MPEELLARQRLACRCQLVAQLRTKRRKLTEPPEGAPAESNGRHAMRGEVQDGMSAAAQVTCMGEGSTDG